MSAMQKKRRNLKMVMLAILILQVIHVFFWCARKEGYYIDELWSYGLANSYYEPFLQEKEAYMGEWHAPDYYLNYLNVEAGERFAFESVYDNQRQDVHPPLYYFILHTISSLFYGTFSKWYGLGINIVCFIAAVWLVFLISRQLLGDSKCSLIPPLCYGFSAGAVSEVLYIRMYMLLGLWILVYVYLTGKMLEEDEMSKGRWRLLGMMASVAAGFLTQYYFVVFVAFGTVGYVVICGIQKKWKAVFSYGMTVCAGGLLGVALFPTSLYHVFTGQKGQDSFSNLRITKTEMLNRMEIYAEIVLKQTAGINDGELQLSLEILIIVGISCAIGMIFLHLKQRKYDLWWVIFCAVSGYFTVISVISTDIADRYQFPVFPFVLLLFISCLGLLLKYIKKERWLWGMAGIFLLLSLRIYGKEEVNYVYIGYQDAMRQLETVYHEVPGVYVTEGDHLVINNCLFLAQQENTIPITNKQITQLPNLLNNKAEEALVLYVDIYYDEEMVARKTAEILGYKSVKKLYDNMFSQIFILE